MKNQNSIFNSFYVLFIGLLLPLTYSGLLLDPTMYLRFGLVSILCIINSIALFQTRKTNKTIEVRKDVRILLLIAIVCVIYSVVNSTNASLGLISLIKLGVYFTLAYTVHLLIKNEVLSLNTLFYGIGLMCLVLIVISGRELIEYVSIHKEIPIDQPIIQGYMANKNLLASALFLCLPSLLILTIKNKWLTRFVAILLIISVLFLLFVIQSKATLIGLFIMLVLLLAFVVKTLLTKIWVSKQRVNVSVVIFTLCVLVISTLLAKPYLKFEIDQLTIAKEKLDAGSSLGDYNVSTQARYVLYSKSTELLLSSPLLGVGPGNWKVDFACLYSQYFGGDVKSGIVNFQRAHSDILQFFVEFGLVFSCIVFIIVCFLIARLVKNNFDSFNQSNTLMVVFFGLSLVGYLPVLMLDFTLERPIHVVFLTFNGLVLFSPIIKTEALLNSLKFNSLLIGFFVFSILGSYVAYNNIRGEYYSAKFNEAGSKEMVAYVKESNSIFYQIDPFSLPVKWYSGVAYYEQGKYDKALEEFKEAERVNPCQINVLNNLASTWVQLRNDTMAIYYYKKALGISPFFEESLINISAIYFNNSEIEKAYEYISLCSPESKHVNYQLFLEAILNAYATLKIGQIDISAEELRLIHRESITSNQSFLDVLQSNLQGKP